MAKVLVFKLAGGVPLAAPRCGLGESCILRLYCACSACAITVHFQKKKKNCFNFFQVTIVLFADYGKHVSFTFMLSKFLTKRH